MPRPAQKRAARGIITGFSAASRKRLIELMASINRTRVRHMPLFVTLTYPGTWVDDPKAWKKHLDTWLKALERKYHGTSAVWKLEFQSRGAPHFHVLLFGIPWLNNQWLSRTWFRIVGSGDVRHLQAGTQVKRVKSWRGVMSYASKYLAKKTIEGLALMVGRYWGVFHRERLPFDLVQITMTHEQYLSMRRLLERWTFTSTNAIADNKKKRRKWRSRRMGGEYMGFTIFADTARTVQLLRMLG